MCQGQQGHTKDGRGVPYSIHAVALLQDPRPSGLQKVWTVAHMACQVFPKVRIKLQLAVPILAGGS